MAADLPGLICFLCVGCIWPLDGSLQARAGKAIIPKFSMTGSELSSQFCFRPFLRCTQHTSSLTSLNADITPCIYLSWGTWQTGIWSWHFLPCIYRDGCQWVKGQSSTCPTEKKEPHVFNGRLSYSSKFQLLSHLLITILLWPGTVSKVGPNIVATQGCSGFDLFPQRTVWVVTCTECVNYMLLVYINGHFYRWMMLWQ